ncbi:MAG: hypothetical protein E7Z89_03560 [Cyanobacteria bacterium SIG28]|nr:hypothetical protein [Cyanobacteria bacterium SIG28]
MLGIGKKVLKASINTGLRTTDTIKNTKLSQEIVSTRFLFSKCKTLADIRNEWQNKLYPEKDIFQKINKK